MKKIILRLALLSLPVLAWLAFFIAFEPNNYFGLRQAANSTAPIARIRAFDSAPGDRIILGDSRFAHFDLSIADEASGKKWQNLAFGGASLKEVNTLLEYALRRNPDLKEVVLEMSFYNLSAAYDIDRMSAVEDTLRNPFAYCLNLEYNINALTNFTDVLAGRGDTEETGDWQYPEDYTGADGTVYDLHTILAVYPAVIQGRCENYRLNTAEIQRFYGLAGLCRARGIALTVVLPPMADNVLAEACIPNGIDAVMTEFLPSLREAAEEKHFRVLDYEWTARPDFDDDTAFFDGFHLDTRHGLPQWTEQLFSELR